MKRIIRISIIILLLILFIMILALILGIYVIRNPWTPNNGELKIKGLNSRVEVLRDTAGIPSIYAADMHDLLFAQGFVHAQDRLWQMEMMRQLCRGSLSTFLGKKTINADIYFRTIGLHRMAVKSYSMLNEESKNYLKYYADGVTAYMNKFKNRLPIEYMLTGLKPKPWQPEDTLVIAGLLALNMGINVYDEIDRTHFISVCGEEAANQLMVDDPEETTSVIKGSISGDWCYNKLTSVFKYLNNYKLSWGSNNLVVHGSRTSTGKPFCATDTHLGLSMPSLWYENNLHMSGFDGSGYSIPGIPLIILGHNNHIFWGFTNLDPDAQDLYIEKLDNEDSPTQYLYKGEYRDIKKVKEVIEVKGSDPMEIEILFTHHGPFVNEAFRLKDWSPITFRWTYYDSGTVFQSLVMLNHAENWNQFKEALRYWDGLHQNFVYADSKGNIGYQAAGMVPIREPDHSGLLPVEGWTGKNEWIGYIPYDELPYLFNPPEGYIATANYRVVDDSYPYKICMKYFPGFRAKRLADLFQSKSRFDIDDIKEIIGDTYSIAAEKILPYFLKIIPENAQQKKALEMLRKWDRVLDVDTAAGAIYETWYYYLLRNVISDELKEFAEYYVNSTEFRKNVLAMEALMKEPDNSWFDDINTEGVEDMNHMLLKSLEDVISRLTELMGKEMEDWRWGEIHKTTLVHQPIGEMLGIFNKTIEAEGGDSTLNQALYVRSEPPFRVVHGTSQRMILDIDDPDRSLTINSTGQNGNLFHPNRLDQTELFQRGEYREMSFSRSKVEETSVSRLMLISE